MKRLKRWLLPLLTMLLIGAGAAMPWAAARFQDLYGVSSQELRLFDPVSLTLRKESDIGTVLRLMGHICSRTDWLGETRLTSEEACQAAFDALMQLDQAGLLESSHMEESNYAEPDILDRLKAAQGCSAVPSLYMTQDGSSAVIWSCHWKDYSGPVYVLFVDDSTGLAVAGCIPCLPMESAEEPYMRMDRWLPFFEGYYGIQIQDVQDNFYTASQFIYLFDPEDGLGSWGLSAYLYDYEMIFGSYIPILEAYGWETDSYNASSTPLPSY